MSRQTVAVPVAALEGVGLSVAATKAAGSAAVPALDRGLVAQLVGDARRQGLPVAWSFFLCGRDRVCAISRCCSQSATS